MFLSVVSVVCCEVEAYATGWFLIQRSPTKCGVSERNRESSIMKRHWPTGSGCAVLKKRQYTLHCVTDGNYLFVQECPKQKERGKKLNDNLSVPNTSTRRNKGNNSALELRTVLIWGTVHVLWLHGLALISFLKLSSLTWVTDFLNT